MAEDLHKKVEKMRITESPEANEDQRQFRQQADPNAMPRFGIPVPPTPPLYARAPFTYTPVRPQSDAFLPPGRHTVDIESYRPPQALPTSADALLLPQERFSGGSYGSLHQSVVHLPEEDEEIEQAPGPSGTPARKRRTQRKMPRVDDNRRLFEPTEDEDLGRYTHDRSPHRRSNWRVVMDVGRTVSHVISDSVVTGCILFGTVCFVFFTIAAIVVNEIGPWMIAVVVAVGLALLLCCIMLLQGRDPHARRR